MRCLSFPGGDKQVEDYQKGQGGKGGLKPAKKELPSGKHQDGGSEAD